MVPIIKLKKCDKHELARLWNTEVWYAPSSPPPPHTPRTSSTLMTLRKQQHCESKLVSNAAIHTKTVKSELKYTHPVIISTNSPVMTACLVRLNKIWNLLIISPAFLEALSIALRRADCSQA